MAYISLAIDKGYSLNFKLNKAQRLRSPKDYRRVYQSKQWGGSTHHTFNVLAGDSQNSQTVTVANALGVTVSKKVSKLAVQRNLIKRQTKEFYRLHQHQLQPFVELVITAKPSCAKADSEQRNASLELLWQKILKWQRWYQKTQLQESQLSSPTC
ncbi:MAG: ribonuclease P protein component [Arenicella sp.]